MKLAGDRVDRFVARPDPTVDLILLHGDDAGLAGERAGRLARGVVDDPGDPFRVTELEPERLRGDPGLLLEEAQSLSLLGGRRLVRVRRAADLISPAVRLLLAADRLAAVVLLEAGELPGSSSLRKLIEAAPRAMALHCRRDEPDAVAALVRRHLAEHGLSIGDEALDHLVANLGADRGLTRQELDKLALYVGDREDRRLDLADIAAIVDDSAALALDDLQRAALLDAPELAGLLDRLLDQGLRPEAVMRTTAALLLQVLRCALAVEAGASAGAAVSQARPPVFGRRKDLVQAALRRWRVPEVTAALAMLRAAEAASRTRRSPTALICRHTLTSLARLPRPGAA